MVKLFKKTHNIMLEMGIYKKIYQTIIGISLLPISNSINKFDR